MKSFVVKPKSMLDETIVSPTKGDVGSIASGGNIFFTKFSRIYTGR